MDLERLGGTEHGHGGQLVADGHVDPLEHRLPRDDGVVGPAAQREAGRAVGGRVDAAHQVERLLDGQVARHEIEHVEALGDEVRLGCGTGRVVDAHPGRRQPDQLVGARLAGASTAAGHAPGEGAQRGQPLAEAQAVEHDPGSEEHGQVVGTTCAARLRLQGRHARSSRTSAAVDGPPAARNDRWTTAAASR